MPTNYLYVDDDKTEALEALINELEHHSNGKLKIHHFQAKPIKDIKTIYISGNYDGILIDQKLDAANEDGSPVDYWGTSLAQDFRTEIIGGALKNAPIVLFSNEDVYLQYYDKDSSAHNLFDFTIGKKAISKCEHSAYEASHILLGLAEAYSIARESVRPLLTGHSIENILQPLLQWDSRTFEYCDPRLLEYLESKLEDTHTLISLILNNFVRSAGILVTEKMLATKLGVAIEESTDWIQLKERFAQYRYKGVFSSLKDRWWYLGIEEWWYENEVSDSALRGLTATERTDAIKKHTGLENLLPIRPKYRNGKQSEKFWINCVETGEPLDICDAILVSKPELKPWEQPIYLDPTVTYERKYKKDKFRVHKDFQEKVKPLYKKLTENDE